MDVVFVVGKLDIIPLRVIERFAHGWVSSPCRPDRAGCLSLSRRVTWAALVFVLLLLACAARRKQGKDPPSAVSKGSREPSASLASKLTDRKGELTEQRGAVAWGQQWQRMRRLGWVWVGGVGGAWNSSRGRLKGGSAHAPARSRTARTLAVES